MVLLNPISPLIILVCVVYKSHGGDDETLIKKRRTALSIVEGSTLRTPIATKAKKFTDLIERGNIFIDKTLMIEELLRFRSPLKIIGRPRGWGKTVNMDMIKTFFEIEVDENGVKLEPHHETRNYKLFRYGELQMKDGTVRKLQKPLLVSKNLTFLELHQGRHPVVYLDFANLKPTNYEEFEQGLIECVCAEYRRHDYLLKVFRKIMDDPMVVEDVQTYAQEDLERYTQLMRKKVKPKEYETSMYFLCEMLYTYYDNKAIILLNEYEAPLKHLLLLEHNTPNRNKAAIFYHRLIRYTWQKNIHYDKTFISGTARVMEGDMDIEIFECLDRYHDPNFHEYQGFSKIELEYIFNHLQLPRETRKYVIDQYHGYRVGLKKFANSHSVAKFLANETNYWIVDETVEIVFRQLLVSDQWQHFLLTMITGSAYNMSLRKDLLEFGHLDLVSVNDLTRHYEDVVKRRVLSFSQNGDFNATSMHNARKLLCASGFFTLALPKEPYLIEMRIPNLQVRSYIKQELLTHLYRQFGFIAKRADRFEGTANQRIACDELNKFLHNRMETSQELGSAVRKFFREMPHLQNINETMQSRRLVFKPEILVFSALNFLTLYMDTFKVIRGAAPYNVFNNTRPGAGTVLRYGTHIAVVELTLGHESAAYAFNRTQHWRHLLVADDINLEFVETVKHVAINYHPVTTEAQVVAKRYPYNVKAKH